MPNLVSYHRFVELMSYALLALCVYFEWCCKGEVTGNREVPNFMVNLVATLIAYTDHPEKPCLYSRP